VDEFDRHRALPTPEVTPLVDAWRTSPATKIPGTLVSRIRDHGPGVQPLGRFSFPHQMRSRTNIPLRVSLNDAAQPIGIRNRAHIEQRALAGTVSLAHVLLFMSVMVSQRPVPFTSMTLVFSFTTMFLVAPICLPNTATCSPKANRRAPTSSHSARIWKNTSPPGPLNSPRRRCTHLHSCRTAPRSLARSSNSRAVQLLHARHVHFAKGNPRRNQQRATADLCAIAQCDKTRRPIHPHPGHFLRRKNLHPKPPGLADRPPCQIKSAKPGREAEVIFDSGTPPACPPGASRSMSTVRTHPPPRRPPPPDRPDRLRQ